MTKTPLEKVERKLHVEYDYSLPRAFPAVSLSTGGHVVTGAAIYEPKVTWADGGPAPVDVWELCRQVANDRRLLAWQADQLEVLRRFILGGQDLDELAAALGHYCEER